MTVLADVPDPGARFVKPAAHLPSTGRGAWTKAGMPYADYRYRINADGEIRLGTTADKSLDAWAVAAGCATIQDRLHTLGLLRALDDAERGLFGPDTLAAVKAFQSGSSDPDGGAALVVDGTVGRSDARALFTPLISKAEGKWAIPNHLLRGEVNHESQLDPGAVGYFIFYGPTLDYRGVDRGSCQINSKSHPDVTWQQAYGFGFAVDWSAHAMRSRFDSYRDKYPNQLTSVLWRAAVLGHNSPAWAADYARDGVPPNDQAAAYVSAVWAARF